MKKKGLNIIICICIFLIIVIGIFLYFIMNQNDEASNDSYSESEVIRTDVINSISSSTYVTTALEETKPLHNTYYFEEIYFEENQEIQEGENILKYTNGSYFVAPYNCVISQMSIPNSGEMCTDKNYLVLQATDTLQCLTSIDEDELDSILVGQEASIKIEALNKTITGYVTKISNTANYSSSGSTFDVTVEFQNDGEILLGMSANCEIILEKAENVIAVPKEAVQEERDKKYVTIKQEDGEAKQVEIETGIENDAFVEVTSGLEEGQIVLIEENSNEQTTKTMQGRGGMQGGEGEFSRDLSGSPPSDMQGGMEERKMERPEN